MGKPGLLTILQQFWMNGNNQNQGAVVLPTVLVMMAGTAVVVILKGIRMLSEPFPQ
ncbi:MAG: hypothetical protein WC620_10530 [Methanoregula sp.]|jgi:hypothetical protein